eukprot:jgi/Botrbrau1/7585/Bobra.0159s0034.1
MEQLILNPYTPHITLHPFTLRLSQYVCNASRACPKWSSSSQVLSTSSYPVQSIRCTVQLIRICVYLSASTFLLPPCRHCLRQACTPIHRRSPQGEVEVQRCRVRLESVNITMGSRPKGKDVAKEKRKRWFCHHGRSGRPLGTS